MLKKLQKQAMALAKTKMFFYLMVAVSLLKFTSQDLIPFNPTTELFTDLTQLCSHIMPFIVKVFETSFDNVIDNSKRNISIFYIIMFIVFD